MPDVSGHIPSPCDLHDQLSSRLPTRQTGGAERTAMRLTIDLETCTIIVHIFNGNRWPKRSYAVFISKLDGGPIRMTIPELIEALERASKRLS